MPFSLRSSFSAAQVHLGCLEVGVWPVHLLVTVDFARTVQPLGNHDLNSFVRPVHWVLSGKNHNTAWLKEA